MHFNLLYFFLANHLRTHICFVREKYSVYIALWTNKIKTNKFFLRFFFEFYLILYYFTKFQFMVLINSICQYIYI